MAVQLITEPPAPQMQARSSENERSGVRPLRFFGPLPPPVTGMTVLTQALLKAVKKGRPVVSYNWSPGVPRRSLWMRLRRNWRMWWSAAKLIAGGRVRNDRLYMVANSFSGLYSTALVLVVAKWLGYTVYMHHHVYYYIDDYDWRMAWLVRRMGPNDIHVVHSERMIEDFRKQYPTKSGFLTVYPSIVVEDVSAPREVLHRPMRLGLLSNLSAWKGLSEAIATFRAATERGLDVTLTLAGPVTNRESQELIDRVVADFPRRVRSIGPKYGDDKKQFFGEIDVFLLPTKSESWGLVLNEALAAGVPVITFDRGCTSIVVGDEAGLLIDGNSNFAAAAVPQIERWIADEEAYRSASHAAVAQARRLHDDGIKMLDQFVHHMFSPIAAVA
jgi:glycosyltransferase involved in cell wall biosynthesis